jgi:hypothetical protein
VIESRSVMGRYSRIVDQVVLSHQTIPPVDEGQAESHLRLEFRLGMANDEAYYTGNQQSTFKRGDKLPDTMLERYTISACSSDCNSFTE